MKGLELLNFAKVYETSNYSLEQEKVPDGNKFSLEGYTYCMIFAPTLNINELNLPSKLKMELVKIKKLGKRELIEF